MRPDVVVTIDGHEMARDGADHQRAAWYGWFLPAGWPPYVLDVGDNLLEFTAEINNESSTSATVNVTCDPTLQTVPGFIRSLTPAQGSDYELVLDGGAIDDQPDGWFIVHTGRFIFDVDADVLFVVYSDWPPVRHTYTAAEFANVLNGCSPATDVAYEVLVDDNDNVHQGLHLDTVLDFCLGE